MSYSHLNTMRLWYVLQSSQENSIFYSYLQIMRRLTVICRKWEVLQSSQDYKTSYSHLQTMRHLTIICLEKIATYDISTALNIHYMYAEVYIHVVYTIKIKVIYIFIYVYDI